MKIIFKFIIFIFFVLIVAVIYLSTVGIETSKLNYQIGSIIKSFNKDLKVDLKKVKIILDPFNLEINAKTLGPKLNIKDKVIELESIKTQIIIKSFLNDNFSLKNLDISTRSLKIENLISFSRNIRDTPELYILEKIIKKGYLISDINLEFDSLGKIKNNYKVKGLIKNAQVKILKKYDLDKINLTFNIEKKKFDLNDVNLSINDLSVIFENISIKNLDNNFFIQGFVEGKDIRLKDKLLSNFVKKNFPKLDFIDLNLKLKNKFYLKLDKKYKINNFKLSSELKIKKLKIKNHLQLKSFFPNVENEISLNDHIINIEYDKKDLLLKGKGKILLQDKEDYITYDLKRKKNIFDIKVNLSIDKNPIIIDFLGYKKKSNSKANIKLSSAHVLNKETIIKSLTFSEDKNIIELNQLVLNKNFKIKSLKKINFKYFDEDLRENNVRIMNKKDEYIIIGSKFNANALIESLTNGESSDLKFFDQKFNLDVNIDQVYLDKEYIINDLIGKLHFKNDEVISGELDAYFSKNKKFKLTIKSNENEKVTTIFLDQAEPIVKRYKFIQGYKGGSLDFYSSKKGKKTISNLNIFDFRL